MTKKQIKGGVKKYSTITHLKPGVFVKDTGASKRLKHDVYIFKPKRGKK